MANNNCLKSSAVELPNPFQEELFEVQAVRLFGGAYRLVLSVKSRIEELGLSPGKKIFGEKYGFSKRKPSTIEWRHGACFDVEKHIVRSLASGNQPKPENAEITINGRRWKRKIQASVMVADNNPTLFADKTALILEPECFRGFIAMNRTDKPAFILQRPLNKEKIIEYLEGAEVFISSEERETALHQLSELEIIDLQTT